MATAEAVAEVQTDLTALRDDLQGRGFDDLVDQADALMEKVAMLAGDAAAQDSVSTPPPGSMTSPARQFESQSPQEAAVTSAGATPTDAPADATPPPDAPAPSDPAVDAPADSSTVPPEPVGDTPGQPPVEGSPEEAAEQPAPDAAPAAGNAEAPPEQ